MSPDFSPACYRFRGGAAPTGPGNGNLWASWLVALYGGWVVTWLIFRHLEIRVALLRDPTAAALWWTAAKLVVWIAPIGLFLRLIPLPPSALRLRSLHGVPWAFVVAVAWIVVNAAADAALRRVPAPTLNPAVISACLVAPFTEELLFRGFAFAWLEFEGVGFWRTNLLCAALFALLHVPGWCFMQSANVSMLQQFAQVAAFGLVLGLLRRGRASLWAPILVHAANNAWSQGLIAWLVRQLFARAAS